MMHRFLASRILFTAPELTVLDEFLEIPAELGDTNLSQDDRIRLCSKHCKGFDHSRIFNFDTLSGDLSAEKYGRSMWFLPKVFLRIRPGQGATVKADLANAGVSFETDPEHDHILSTDHGKQVTETTSYRNGLFEIQDRSSQIAASMILVTEKQLVWDCFAGAGGKCLCIADATPGIRIVASDKRASIVRNLNERIRRNRVQNIDTMVYDILGDDKPSHNIYDSAEVVIADVPCSGSGTWARHPENLTLFEPSAIEKFASLQRQLMTTLSKKIRRPITIYYITCSVFRAENEEIMEFCESELNYKCLESSLISGVGHGADSMFIARLVLDRHEAG